MRLLFLLMEFLKVNNHQCTHPSMSYCLPIIQLTSLFARGRLMLKVRASLLCPLPLNLPPFLFLLISHLRHLHVFLNGSGHEDASRTHGNPKAMQEPLVTVDGAFQLCLMHHLHQCHPQATHLHSFLFQAASCLLCIPMEICLVTWRTQQPAVHIDGFSVMAVEYSQWLVHVINLM